MIKAEVPLERTRDVLILRLLADQPPDRVGVVRSLKLGGCLKRKLDGGVTVNSISVRSAR